MTKQNVATPLLLLFAILPTYMLYNLSANYYMTGRWPQALQRQGWLYRKGNYGVQERANANPDNHYDRMHNCWTSDPNCGVDVGPKRPWLDLKDPTQNLVKFNRDADENKYVKAMGWRGY